MEKSKDTQSLFVEVMAVFFFTLGILTFISLLAFSDLFDIDAKGTMGNMGSYVSQSLGSSFGMLSFVFPALMFYSSYLILKKQPAQKIYWKLFSTIIFLLSSTTLLGLAYGKSSLLGYAPAGGWIGLAVSREFSQNISGTLGTYIIAVIVIFLSVIITTETKLSQVAKFTLMLLSVVLKKVLALTSVLKHAAARKIRIKKKTRKHPTPIRAEKPLEAVEKQQESDHGTDAEPQIVLTSPYEEKKTEAQSSTPENSSLHFSLPLIHPLDPKIPPSQEIDKDARYHNSTLI